jgi:site-specific recombinase XerD
MSLDLARAFVAKLQERTVSWQGHPHHPEVSNSLSPYTVHAYVRVLKVFSGWLYEEGFTPLNTLAKLKRPRLPQPMIEILSDDEQKAIFAVINPNCFLGARLMVITLLLLDTGMRASELCTLTVDNVHLDEGYVKVFGKGSKERIIPISNKTKMALMRYLNAWRPQPASDTTHGVILTDEGRPMSYPGLRQVIKRLGKKAGIPRLHPHLFRHTFAVNYLMNGGDVMTLKLILGHTTLEVTQVYMHLAESHVKIQHSRFSPVEKLDIKVTGRKRAK